MTLRPASILSIDFETASECDLRRTGARVYAEHPSTRILCMSWAFDDEPVATWRPGQPFPVRIKAHVAKNGRVRGWHVAFEHEIWRFVLPRMDLGGMGPIPMLIRSQLRDTMAQAAYWGLPMKLDDAGPASGAAFVKDKDGHKLMLQMCKPRSRDPATGVAVWWHETDQTKYDRLCEYCERDVETERAIAARLPPLPDREQALWELDRKINDRGVLVDQTLVSRLKVLTQDAKIRLQKDLIRLTNSQVTSVNKAAVLLGWLKSVGYPHNDLKRNTVAERLKDPACRGLERRALLIRKEAARASTAKLRVLKDAVARDGRMHGMLQHYGATRTGRWAGRLFQPQNLPRPSVKHVDAMVDAVLDGANDNDVELLSTDSTPGTVASLLRSTLIAAPGKTFAVADFSQIEARVVAWLAGQQDILDVFASGEDVYVYTAAKIGSTDRQLGKVLVLACGFGMGWSKFKDTAKTYGIKLTDEQAQEYVAAWRDANPKIVKFWYDVDDLVKRIARREINHGVIGSVSFRRRKNSLLIRLPSGRDLVYRRIEMLTDPDTGRENITYLGQNQITKKWGEVRTYGGKLVENITQAVARDILADALLELDQHGDEVVLTIHDEALNEVAIDAAVAALKRMLAVMSRTPKWAPGLPVGAAGWVGPRYKKA